MTGQNDKAAVTVRGGGFGTMGKRALLLFVAVLLVTVPSCRRDEEKRTTFTAMDTVMSITLTGAPDADGCIAEAKRIVSDMEAELSVTDEKSAVYRANSGQTVALSDNAAALCRRALFMCEKTHGALDVTVYPLVRAWGFTTDQYRVPHQSEIDSLLLRTGYGRVNIDESGALTLDEGMMLDLGAVAKGYASDLICDMLAGRGVTSAMINLGGNVRTLGKKPDGSLWRVGITSPDGDGNSCVLEIGEGAVVTSGSYERFFEADGKRYCHIIDPSSGYPADSGISSVTVIGESGFECDALSTALFVMGLDGAVSFWRQNGGFEMVLIADGTLYATEGIAHSVEVSEEYVGVNVIEK